MVVWFVGYSDGTWRVTGDGYLPPPLPPPTMPTSFGRLAVCFILPTHPHSSCVMVALLPVRAGGHGWWTGDISRVDGWGRAWAFVFRVLPVVLR